MIKLPCSSSRSQRLTAHLKILTHVSPDPSLVAFDGHILRPGTSVPVEVLEAHPLVLECAGFASGVSKPRSMIWILWKYDQEHGQWMELARAAAPDASWVPILRDLARREMYTEVYSDRDMQALRHQQIAQVLMQAVDGALDVLEVLEDGNKLKSEVLQQVYSEVAARIAVAQPAD